MTGFGEPPWLAAGPQSPTDPTTAADLRAFGQVAFGWSQLAAKKKGARPAKAFPAALAAVIRRLEADPEPPMADTVAADRPYASRRGVGRGPEASRPRDAVQRRRVGEAAESRRRARPGFAADPATIGVADLNPHSCLAACGFAGGGTCRLLQSRKRQNKRLTWRTRCRLP